MRVVVRSSPLAPALLDSGDASTVELRDDAGTLVAVFLFPPGGKTFFYSRADEPDFDSFAQAMGFERHVIPTVT